MIRWGVSTRCAYQVISGWNEAARPSDRMDGWEEERSRRRNKSYATRHFSGLPNAWPSSEWVAGLCLVSSGARNLKLLAGTPVFPLVFLRACEKEA